MSTIKDVARLAKVSVATVSNVLNKTAGVSEEKLRRVHAAIEQLKYVPNVHAKNLRSRERRVFAVILCELDETTQRIAEGIADVCAQKNATCNLCVTHYNRVAERNCLQELQNAGVSGIFLQTCDSALTPVLQSLLQKNTPLVFIDNYIGNALNSAVVFNNTSCVENALLAYRQKHGTAGSGGVVLLAAPERFCNDADVCLGAQRALDDRFERLKIPVSEEEAFFRLVKYFENARTYPELFVCAKQSVANAVFRLIDYYEMPSTVMYLSNDLPHAPSKHIALTRRAYRLGEKAAEKMFQFVKAPLLFDRVLSVVHYKPSHEEKSVFTVPSAETLRLTLYDGPTASALIPALRAYQRRFGVEIRYELLPYDRLFERIRAVAAEKSDCTDLMMIDLPWFELFHNAGHFYPLGGLIERDGDGWLQNFSEEIKRIYFYTGSEIYSIPILTNMQFLFYRKDLFENSEIKRAFYHKYGIELAPPKTWLDFEIVAKFFTRSFNPNSPVEFGTTLQGMDAVTIAEEFFPRQWYYGGKIVSSRKAPIFDSQPNTRAFLNLKNTYLCTPRDQIAATWENNSTKLIKNEIAMYFTFATHIGADTENPLGIDFTNIGAAQVPGGYSMLGGYNLGINAYSQNIGGAFHLLKWLTSDAMAVHNTLMGCCIPHASVFRDDLCLNAFPWLKHIQAFISAAKKRESIRNVHNKTIPTKTIDHLIYRAALRVFGDEEISAVLQDTDEVLRELIHRPPTDD